MAGSIYDDLSPDWLVATYLAGIDLTLDDGTPFDARMLRHALRGAIDYVKTELSLQLDVVKIRRERHDASAKQKDTWWFFCLDHRPVQNILACRMHYGQTPPVDLPTDWLNIMNEVHGHIQVVPTTTAVGTFQFIGGVPSALTNMIGGYLPGYMEFDYESGFTSRSGTFTVPVGETEATVTLPGLPIRVADYHLEFTLVNPDDADEGIQVSVTDRDDTTFAVDLDAAPEGLDGLTVAWTLSTIPDDLRECIGLRASMLALDVAGDLIIGAGIASQSTSMDGLSQSIGSTSSATNSGYGARVLQFERELKLIMPALRGKYRMPGLFAF